MFESYFRGNVRHPRTVASLFRTTIFKGLMQKLWFLKLISLNRERTVRMFDEYV